MSALLTIILCEGKPLEVANCTRWRATGCAARCTKFGPIDPTRCRACPIRRPVMGEPMRGLGDLVAACIRVLFLGRVDIAERLAAALRQRTPTPGKAGVSGGCGCKQRQQALNRAIPFRRHAH